MRATRKWNKKACDREDLVVPSSSFAARYLLQIFDELNSRNGRAPPSCDHGAAPENEHTTNCGCRYVWGIFLNRARLCLCRVSGHTRYILQASAKFGQ